MVTYSGSQEVSIGGGCQYVNSIVHEIGHALGFIHEHSRYDRDEYIQIMTDNIMEGRLHNFYKAEIHDVITEGVQYDTSSIMHYGTRYFTKNGQETIKARNVIDQWKLNHRDGLSFYDIKLANYIYNCNASCELLPCENGGYIGPECNCVCNQGFSGNLCEVPEPANRGCVYQLTDTDGVIMSDQYPSNYANYQDCLILISGQVGSTIVLKFEHFDVEHQEGCLYDYLEIRSQNIDKDGTRYCGSSLPPQIESVGNEILLKFVTDASITESGFKATYNVMDHLDHWSEWSDCFPSCAIGGRQRRHRECAGTAVCNGRMFEEKDCDIDSCIVKTTIGPTTDDPVTELRVKTTIGPTTDDPVTELRVTCGPNICKNGGKLDAQCECLCIPGYYGPICELKHPSALDCTYKLVDSKGNITSPGFPSDYVNELDCNILISGGEGTTIKLTFEYIDVEDAGGCVYDYIDVRPDDIYSEGNKYCGTTLPPVIESSREEMLLRFYTDISITETGFRARYEIINHLSEWTEWSNCSRRCDGGVQNRTRECTRTWPCNVPLFEERPCNEEPCHVTTTIRPTTDDPVTELGEMCEPNICKNGGELNAQCACLCKPGYYGPVCELKYPSSLDCTYELVDSKGNITSPGFPSDYFDGLDCNILISGGEGTTIKLTFEYIDIEDAAGCVYDYIDVRPDDIYSEGNKYCGTTLPPVIESSREEMLLRFYTDTSITRTGFRARYEVISHLSEWTEWSNCSNTCNGGVQNRTRECTRTRPCNVPLVEERPCNEEPCHIFSEWTSWSECVNVYGYYDKVRLRFCPDGDYLCSGPAIETVSCDKDE